MNDYTRRAKLPPGAKWERDKSVNHEYKDELGTLRFIVWRENAIFTANRQPVINVKTGKQIKKYPQSWWGTRNNKKPPGARALIYKLPEVLKAIKDGNDIYVVEGENKVVLLRNWGFCATCSPGGAGNWEHGHAELLRYAKRIIILPDNDEAGRRHADKVGSTLEDVVHQRCLLELPDLPEHGDVIDWAKNGGTLEQFKTLEPREWEPYGEPDDADLGVVNAGDLLKSKPPPRGWLFGNIFARKFLSSLFGDGGVGKTALRYTQLLSLAIGRSLTGDHVFQRCRVLIISLEDDIDELHRRLEALMLHYNVKLEDVRDWLFLAAPGARKGKLMTLDKGGRLKEGRLATMIEAEVIRHNIDIVSLDPFVKTHSVEENANSMIDEVAQVLVDIMYKHDISIDAPHHISKGPADPGNANRGRGASAMKDAARLVYTLTPMSTDEAKAYGVMAEERLRLVRMDSGKVNITPPLHMARWYKLIGIKLGNETELYPNGDEVQAIEQWFPPDAWQDLSESVINIILADIDAGLPKGVRYSDAPTAKKRGAWNVVIKHAPEKTQVQARDIIKAWVKNGTLLAKEYENQQARKKETGLWRNPAKRPRITRNCLSDFPQPLLRKGREGAPLLRKAVNSFARPFAQRVYP
jgi:hypothetical protein